VPCEEHLRAGARGLDFERAQRGEQQRDLAFVFEHALHALDHELAVDAGDGQRSPGGAQADADGGFVGPLPADVSHHGAQMAVGGLCDVEEVAAEQRAVASGAVARGDPDGAVADQRPRRESAFQARDLARLDVCEAQLVLGVCGLTADDRIADGAGELRAVDLALDEVVLGAGVYSRHPRCLVVEPGEHDQGDVWRLRAQPYDRVDALGVGQLQVEQHTVDAGVEHAQGVAEPATAQDARFGKRFAEQVIDDQRIAVVILHQQHAQHRADRITVAGFRLAPLGY
jgi:hypothetical protein